MKTPKNDGNSLEAMGTNNSRKKPRKRGNHAENPNPVGNGGNGPQLREAGENVDQPQATATNAGNANNVESEGNGEKPRMMRETEKIVRNRERL